MACFYNLPSALFTSSSTPNTALLAMALTAGSTLGVGVRSAIGNGRDTARTNLNALQYELIKWTSTATVVNTGSTITPAKAQPGFQASKCAGITCTGQGGTSLTTGTGGPIVHATWSSSLTSSQTWQEYNPDASPYIEGAATMSIDVRISSPIASALCFSNLAVAE